MRTSLALYIASPFLLIGVLLIADGIRAYWQHRTAIRGWVLADRRRRERS
jgi:hypothetical protein